MTSLHQPFSNSCPKETDICKGKGISYKKETDICKGKRINYEKELYLYPHPHTVRNFRWREKENLAENQIS
jgi:hypothetical protein